MRRIVGSILVGGENTWYFCSLFPPLNLSKEFHMLPHHIDGSWVNSIEVAVWRDREDMRYGGWGGGSPYKNG